MAAGLLAAVATTVADLHAMGVVHGRIEPSHVVVDGVGRPVLCGFGGPEPTAVGPGPADDVAAVGRLIDHLLGPEAEPEPIPDRRWIRRPWAGYDRRALQLLADRATHEDPARRPTARALANAIIEAVPKAHLDPPLTPGRGQPPPQSPTTRPSPIPAYSTRWSNLPLLTAPMTTRPQRSDHPTGGCNESRDPIPCAPARSFHGSRLAPMPPSRSPPIRQPGADLARWNHPGPARSNSLTTPSSRSSDYDSNRLPYRRLGTETDAFPDPDRSLLPADHDHGAGAGPELSSLLAR